MRLALIAALLGLQLALALLGVLNKDAVTVVPPLTLEANRVRQAEITQEIMEVVAGAEALG